MGQVAPGELVLTDGKGTGTRVGLTSGSPNTIGDGTGYVRNPSWQFSRLTWDQGPILMTAGPWRPVRLETYTYRFEDVRVDSDLAGPDYKTASLKATVELAPSAASTSDLKLKALLKTSGGKTVKEAELGVKEGLDWKFDKGEVEAWWPVHYGKQPLYQLDLVLSDKVSYNRPGQGC